MKRRHPRCDRRWAIVASKRFFPRQADALRSISHDLGFNANLLVSDHTRSQWRWRYVPEGIVDAILG